MWHVVLLVVFCQGNKPIVDVTARAQLSAAAPPGNIKTFKKKNKKNKKRETSEPFYKVYIFPL